jgi:beta-N-acetylhexosaminidase
MEWGPPEYEAWKRREEEEALARRRRREQAAMTRLRRLRSLLPVSPIPPRAQRRLRRLIVLTLAGGVVAAIVAGILSREEQSGEAAGESPGVSSSSAELARGLSPEQMVDTVLLTGMAPGRATAGGPGEPLEVARQEGGAYRAFADLPPAERQLDVGVRGSADFAEAWARETGAALRSAGFDLNLAPLADVATLDSPVADRAFGDDPALVSELTAAAVRGCSESGIACAVAHFPGLGGASNDVTQGPATVSLDRGSLESRDLAPFRTAFEAGAPAVVLSVAYYAAYDPVTPAALSPAVATDLLRNEIGFEGVAITDDLSSGAVGATHAAPAAAVGALLAGSDLVFVSDPGQARQARAALLGAARSGAVPADRLEEAVARVLELKKRLGLLPEMEEL